MNSSSSACLHLKLINFSRSMPFRKPPILVIFLYSNIALLKWLILCSETKNSSQTFYETASGEQQNEKKYSETSKDSNETYAEYFVFVKDVPLISGPLIENISQDLNQNRKRTILVGGFSYDVKVHMLQLHNLYRSNVTPSAGNMAFMEWDNELERLAQIWADKCDFEHGMPDNDYPDTIGQNLYIGTDPTGYNAVWLWYEEYNYYDLKKQYCRPEKQCGHFIQLAWAPSDRLGCGMQKCGMRYFVVCHYSHQALRGIQMYLVAKPCSQCPEREGALCLKNLCLSWEQCKRLPFECEFARCNLKCHNCGKLDKEKCRCDCADGWDSPDCSNVCEDQHKRCGKSPGWPSIAACSLNNHAVAETFCRKMCGKCKPIDEESVPNIGCCAGEFCADGLVPSTDEDCECVLPCPGPKCEKNMTTTETITTGYIQEEIEYDEKAESSVSKGGTLQLKLPLFSLYQIIALWFLIK